MSQVNALPENDIEILQALKKARPQTLTQEQIATKTMIPVRTIQDKLPSLRKRRLIKRPAGKKGGETITAMGLALLGSADEIPEWFAQLEESQGLSANFFCGYVAGICRVLSSAGDSQLGSWNPALFQRRNFWRHCPPLN